MISKKEILDNIQNGKIVIEPFDETKLGPVSYDMSLDDTIHVYKKEHVLDTNKKSEPDKIIDLFLEEKLHDGFMLVPGNLYIAKTKEFVKSDSFIPCISGRSTYARMGIQVHQTAFFANPGHSFCWVLEISVVTPVIIHPGILLSQMYFERIDGEINPEDLYSGKYVQKNDLAIPD